jgi:hypothetical protein
VDTLDIKIVVGLAAAIVALTVVIIILAGKRREKGYNPKAKDGDGDGIVQENTVWERPAGTTKIVPAKKAPAKKAAAKKAAAKKAAPKKK